MDAIDDLEIEQCIIDAGALSENITDIIKSYNNHSSVVKTKENVQLKEKFKCKDITSTQIKHEIDRIE